MLRPGGQCLQQSAPIDDYALIGDTHTTALISAAGSIDWLCWPRHDSPALLTRLLDAAHGGCAEVRIRNSQPATRRYLDRTNILETRFEGPAGTAMLTDLMPLRQASPGGPLTEIESSHTVLRLLRCAAGHLTGQFALRVTPDYGRRMATLQSAPDGVFVAAGPLVLRIASSVPLRIEADTILADFDLRAGDRILFAITLHSGTHPALRWNAATGQRLLEETCDYWTRWCSGIRYAGRYAAAITRSALVLKLLTHSPTGAIIAAPTTSLPEAVPGNRNFDYRFSWIRDASFTATAFSNLGLTDEACAYLKFLRGRAPDVRNDLRLLFAIEGETPEEQVVEQLPGWRGVSPVRVGNAAGRQRQLDIYGEYLLAIHAYLEAVDGDAPAAIGEGLGRLITDLADTVYDLRDQKDCGIWELRTEPQHLQHTKALLWVALTKAAALADQLPGISRDDAHRWSRAAGALRREYEARTWNDERKAYMQAYESDVLDAAVLRTVLFGALDCDDARTASTLEAIEDDLVVGDLVYRYRMNDGLSGEEATFTPCAFWRVGVLALGGRAHRAQAIFERLLGKATDLGLFAEQIDPQSGEQRGNFPQAFTHMTVINHALRLESCLQQQQGPDKDG